MIMQGGPGAATYPARYARPMPLDPILPHQLDRLRAEHAARRRSFEKFGKEEPTGSREISTVSAAMTMPGSFPAPVPGHRLEALPGLVRAVGKLLREDLPTTLARGNAVLASDIRKTAEHAPRQVHRLVIETMVEAAADLGLPRSMSERIAREAHAPRSPEEAARSMETLIGVSTAAPALKPVVEKALDVLESKGVLGQATLGILAAAGMTAMATAPSRDDGQARTIDLGLLKLSADAAHRYAASATVHNPAWAKQAVSIALGTGKEGKGLETSTVSMGLPLPASRGGRTAATASLQTNLADKERTSRVKTGVETRGRPGSTNLEGSVEASLVTKGARSGETSVTTKGKASTELDGRTRLSVDPAISMTTGPGGRSGRGELSASLEHQAQLRGGGRVSASLSPSISVLAEEGKSPVSSASLRGQVSAVELPLSKGSTLDLSGYAAGQATKGARGAPLAGTAGSPLSGEAGIEATVHFGALPRPTEIPPLKPIIGDPWLAGALVFWGIAGMIAHPSGS